MSCSSSPKVSHEWLDTLLGNNRTNNRNNAPSPETITAATIRKRDRLIMLFFLQSRGFHKFEASSTHLVTAVRLPLGVEDTGHVTTEHRLTNLLFLLFSSFFCPFVIYCLTSTVSSTPSRT